MGEIRMPTNSKKHANLKTPNVKKSTNPQMQRKLQVRKQKEVFESGKKKNQQMQKFTNVHK